MAKFWYMRLFGRAAFENSLHYRHTDSKIFNGNILATFCASLMKIGPVNPEITTVTNAPFLGDVAKTGLSHRKSQQLLDRSSPTFQRW